MQIKEIVQKISPLPIFEKREQTDDYIEVVFYMKDLVDWNIALIECLGEAAKPAGVKPSREDSDMTSDFGGIYINQTLYRKDFNTHTIIACLWPWGDAEHLTLKIALINI